MIENNPNSEMVNNQQEVKFVVPSMFPSNIPVRERHPLYRAWTEAKPKVFESAVVQFDEQTEKDLIEMERKRDVYYVLGIGHNESDDSFAFGTELSEDGTVGGIFEFSLSQVVSYQSA